MLLHISSLTDEVHLSGVNIYSKDLYLQCVCMHNCFVVCVYVCVCVCVLWFLSLLYLFAASL